MLEEVIARVERGLGVAAPGGKEGEGSESNEEKLEREREDAEVRQFSDQGLREKAQRTQKMLTGEIADRLPDRGRKLRMSLDAMHRELTRRQGGARAPVSRFSSFVVLSSLRVR